MEKFCTSCSRTKPAGDFLHPIKGTPGKTCAACIVKKSKGASTSADVDATATLQLHTARLDDHEGRIKSVEETLYDYDAAGAPPAPDAPVAGDGTFTKSQLRRQKRKNKMAARAAARALDFVLVGDDAASDSTDLDSLASTHSCVRALIEENRQLSADLRGMRGMRLLLRDPSFLQRVGRGMVGRSRAKSRLAAVRKIQVLVRRRAKRKFAAAAKIQAWVRGSLHASLWRKCRRSLIGLQGRARVRKARAICQRQREIKAAVGIGAAWRRYHVLSTMLFGKLLSRSRAAVRLERELAEANWLLAANERDLKNVVHAKLCVKPPKAGLVKGASPFMEILSKLSLAKFLHELKNYRDISSLPAVAQLITKDLKVEVKGDEEGVWHWTDKAVKDGLPSQSHAATITAVRGDGQYDVKFDSIYSNPETPEQEFCVKTLRATQFRIL